MPGPYRDAETRGLGPIIPQSLSKLPKASGLFPSLGCFTATQHHSQDMPLALSFTREFPPQPGLSLQRTAGRRSYPHPTAYLFPIAFHLKSSLTMSTPHRFPPRRAGFLRPNRGLQLSSMPSSCSTHCKRPAPSFTSDDPLPRPILRPMLSRSPPILCGPMSRQVDGPPPTPPATRKG